MSGLLVAAGKMRRLVSGFVSLDSIPLEPHFRAARQRGEVEFAELDEGMLQWGLLAAAQRLPFLPIRAGLGSDVMRVKSPPAHDLIPVRRRGGVGRQARAHPRRGDHPHEPRRRPRNSQFLGPDPYLDDLYCLAATQRFMSCERVVETEDLLKEGSFHTLKINRLMVDGVVETPNGAPVRSWRVRGGPCRASAPGWRS